MTRNSSSLRRASALLLALPVVFALSSCKAGVAPAATIDGKKISGDSFLEGARIYTRIASAINQTAVPDESDRVDSASTAAYLNLLIQAEALHQVVQDRKVEVTDAQRKEADAALSSSLPGTAGSVKFSELPAWFRDPLVEFQAEISALTADLLADPKIVQAARGYYDANRDSAFVNWCLDVIVAPSLEDGTAAHDRITAGEDFAAVAKDVASKSQNPALGAKQDGDLGCRAASDFLQGMPAPAVSAMRALKEGQVSAPLDLGQGSVAVIRQRKIAVQPFSEVEPQITNEIAQQELEKLATAKMNALDVEVNPKFGSWTGSTGGFQVTPPQGPERPAQTVDLSQLGATPQSPPPPAG